MRLPVKPLLVAQIEFTVWTPDGTCGTGASPECAMTKRLKRFDRSSWAKAVS